MTLKRIVFGLVFTIACSAVAAAEKWDHVHLVATDTAAAAKWYAEMFDGEMTKSGTFDAVLFGDNLVKFRAGNDVRPSSGSSVDHIAFSVENIEAKTEQIEAAGLDTGRQSRRAGSSVVFDDPWGTKVELLNDPDLRGFHHVHLASQQPGKVLDWYQANFGGESALFQDIAHMRALRFDSMWVIVQQSVRPVAPTAGRAIDHIGWQVADFDATVARLKAEKTPFVVEPRPSGDHRIAFIEGPDGTKIELVSAAE